MRDFADLCYDLERALDDRDRHEALLRYWQHADSLDRMWSLWLLLDHRPPRRASAQEVMEWVAEWTGYPDWLLAESREVASDVAETAALLVVGASPTYTCTLHEWLDLLLALQLKDPDRSARVLEAWQEMDAQERYWFNRLLLGTYRSKLSVTTLVRALAAHTGRPAYTLWYRLLGDWSPAETDWQTLLLERRAADQWQRPLGLILPQRWTSAGPPEVPSAWRVDWWRGEHQVELQWRAGNLNLWSASGAWWNPHFPELLTLADHLPESVVLQAELLPFRAGHFLPPQRLAERLAKKPRKKNREACPVLLLLTDLLEYRGEDWRSRPLSERWATLQTLFAHPTLPDGIVLAEALPASSTAEIQRLHREASAASARGLVLRSRGAAYGEMQYYWPLPDRELLATLLYLTRDERNPARFKQLSFGVWKGETLITICKCNYEPEASEYDALLAFVSDHTIERFGPVVSVKAQLVFRLAYRDLQPSRRRKSGLELIEPRILRWEKAASTTDVPQIRELLRGLVGS